MIGVRDDSPAWTWAEDRKLIEMGRFFADGYAYVASVMLGRPPAAGPERISWLREHKPDHFKRIEALAQKRDGARALAGH